MERYRISYRYNQAPMIELCGCDSPEYCEGDSCGYSWQEAVKCVVDWRVSEITKLRYCKPEDYFNLNTTLELIRRIKNDI